MSMTGREVIYCGWSEPAATNAPVQDEPVEVVLRMNKNPILLALMDFFFPPLLCPKIFPPPYLPPTSPLLPTTYQPLPPSLHRQNSRNIEWERAWSWSRSCWSRSLELGAAKAWSLELCLESEPAHALKR